MGTVYLRRHRFLKRGTALKVSDPLDSGEAEHSRFLREAQILATLDSPHIVKIYDFGILRGQRLFLACEYARGGSLADRLARSGRLIWDAARPIVEGGRRFCPPGACYCMASDLCFPAPIAAECCEGPVMCSSSSG